MMPCVYCQAPAYVRQVPVLGVPVSDAYCDNPECVEKMRDFWQARDDEARQDPRFQRILEKMRAEWQSHHGKNNEPKTEESPR